MRHADADAACGCVKQHAFCLNPCVRNGVRFICIFRRRLACNWRRIGPRLQRLDDVMYGKLSCNRLRMTIITTRRLSTGEEEEETNALLLDGRLKESERERG